VVTIESANRKALVVNSEPQELRSPSLRLDGDLADGSHSETYVDHQPGERPTAKDRLGRSMHRAAASRA
jgi:hypothetical protein